MSDPFAYDFIEQWCQLFKVGRVIFFHRMINLAYYDFLVKSAKKDSHPVVLGLYIVFGESSCLKHERYFGDVADDTCSGKSAGRSRRGAECWRYAILNLRPYRNHIFWPNCHYSRSSVAATVKQGEDLEEMSEWRNRREGIPSRFRVSPFPAEFTKERLLFPYCRIIFLSI